MKIDFENLSQVRNVLMFFIRAKDMCNDPVVLFDRPSAEFAIKLAKAFESAVKESDDRRDLLLKSYDFFLPRNDELLKSLINRLKNLIAHDKDVQDFIQPRFDSALLTDVITAYLSPYFVDDETIEDTVLSVQFATSAIPGFEKL